jgi:hypothetical protein
MRRWGMKKCEDWLSAQSVSRAASYSLPVFLPRTIAGGRA